MNSKVKFILLTILALAFFTSCTAVRNQNNKKEAWRDTRPRISPTQKNVVSDGVDGTSVVESQDGNISEDYLTDQNGNDDQEKRNQQLIDEALSFYQRSQDFWQKGEVDSAINALDKSYALILRVEPENDTKLAQQKEDIRLMISKHIVEINDSKKNIARGRYSEIPIILNKHVEAEISSFTGREKNFLIESYKRSGAYRPYIVAALKEAGIPTELSWLPLIESGFKVKALSKARALGPWQFIASTGYRYGLKRDTFVDERIDPIKSTQAAISYLKELHQMFGDWMTVLAAYNCGEMRVLRVINEQKINYLDNFWDLYERLPRETARYVPRFLATLHIINNPDQYGLSNIELDSPIDFEMVTISKQCHLKDIAQSLECSEDTLSDLNPELRYRILPQDSYSLKIPKGKSEALMEKVENLPTSYIPSTQVSSRYKSKPSFIDTEADSKSIKISKSRYAKKRNKILLAQTYKVDPSEIQESIKTKYRNKETHQNNKNQKNDDSMKRKTYNVKKGDTLFKIAQKNNMPIKQFLKLNRLSHKSKLYPGKQVYIE
ncbi:MAG: transglycosylase SLT domain-containing protein [Desulfobacterales bacterium]|nr:transglycosylase SLT domain-containing protein [Desulfobacterales bacterium]MBF0396338.1 transglycosylase SLT domain-containing protein [Desulfobacterales bacterium]